MYTTRLVEAARPALQRFERGPTGGLEGYGTPVGSA